MIQISFSDEIRAAAPALRVLVAEAEVTNSPTPDALWQELIDACAEMAGMPMEAVNKRPAIAATRAAYRRRRPVPPSTASPPARNPNPSRADGSVP